MPSFVDFEWDDNKRAANAEKHGIDFADAVKIFDDPQRLTFRASHRSEERFLSIGTMRGRIVTVVFHAARRQSPDHFSATCAQERTSTI